MNIGYNIIHLQCVRKAGFTIKLWKIMVKNMLLRYHFLDLILLKTDSKSIYLKFVYFQIFLSGYAKLPECLVLSR
jgi:hypothetical protein